MFQPDRQLNRLAIILIIPLWLNNSWIFSFLNIFHSNFTFLNNFLTSIHLILILIISTCTFNHHQVLHMSGQVHTSSKTSVSSISIFSLRIFLKQHSQFICVPSHISFGNSSCFFNHKPSLRDILPGFFKHSILGFFQIFDWLISLNIRRLISLNIWISASTLLSSQRTPPHWTPLGRSCSCWRWWGRCRWSAAAHGRSSWSASLKCKDNLVFKNFWTQKIRF